MTICRCARITAKRGLEPSRLLECCGTDRIGISGISICVVATDAVLILGVASQAGVGETRDVCPYNRDLCERSAASGSLDLEADFIVRIVLPREIDLSARNGPSAQAAWRLGRIQGRGASRVRVPGLSDCILRANAVVVRLTSSKACIGIRSHVGPNTRNLVKSDVVRRAFDQERCLVGGIVGP